MVDLVARTPAGTSSCTLAGAGVCSGETEGDDDDDESQKDIRGTCASPFEEKGAHDHPGSGGQQTLTIITTTTTNGIVAGTVATNSTTATAAAEGGISPRATGDHLADAGPGDGDDDEGTRSIGPGSGAIQEGGGADSGRGRTIASIEHLSFRYPDASRPAVRDVSMDIGEGEIVLLAGPSGCGKSTLLRCINGLIPHMYPGSYEGSVHVGGLKVSETPMSTLAQNVGLLFQNPENQIFMFSVERDIAFGLQNLSVPREEMRSRVDEAMRLLGISDLALRAPHELSDGQKQRAALAGVIVMRPKLIILDEPTSLLDPKTALEVVSLIERLNRELGITFIVVEHRLELFVPIAGRLVVMDDGAKVMDGPPHDVLSDDRAEGYGVGVPPIARLYNALARDGIRLPRVPQTPEEMAEELNQL
jgi:energy-coupling factor transport system ATP-binding protein